MIRGRPGADRQMLTSGAGLAAVPREQDGVVAVQLRAVLLDVLTVDFPKHFATTALLLPDTETEKQTHESLSSCRPTATNSFSLELQPIKD